MKEAGAFLKVKRRKTAHRPAHERVKDYRDVAIPREEEQSEEQASRCLNCGLPFCHLSCPVHNFVPEWNDRVACGRWDEAYRLLQSTNNIPEVTGRICPAMCETACVLSISEEPVTIRENELAVIEHAFAQGWVKPHPPRKRTGKSVAVIGSGPAGLCSADQLNKAGHRVVVFERDEKVGGLLRYGIPDFKLEKWVLDRRVEIWKAEGIEFQTGVTVGSDVSVSKLKKEFDAVFLAGGSRVPRDLKVEGRELKGIHFAMEYLAQSNRRVEGAKIPAGQLIDAKGRKVVVIGGGDTGADCVGTAHRQGASQVVQIELLPRPPIVKTSTSHEEGGRREWAVLTKKFSGAHGSVAKLSCVRVEFSKPAPGLAPSFHEIPGTGFDIEADLVFLAMGFLHPEPSGLLKDLGVRLDSRGNVETDDRYQTSIEGIFSGGDMRRGQSLVVWAIGEGRSAAHHIDRHLMGASDLPLF